MKVVSDPDPASLSQIGPKSLGGHEWRTDKRFDEVKTKWTSPGFGVVAPCTLFGWAGLFKKVVVANEVPEMITMQLLGTVDYDFDKDDNHKPGMGRSGEVAGRNCIKRGSRLQGGAMVGFIMIFNIVSAKFSSAGFSAARARPSKDRPISLPKSGRWL
jgi:hypothetical protein